MNPVACICSSYLWLALRCVPKSFCNQFQLFFALKKFKDFFCHLNQQPWVWLIHFLRVRVTEFQPDFLENRSLSFGLYHIHKVMESSTKADKISNEGFWDSRSQFLSANRVAELGDVRTWQISRLFSLPTKPLCVSINSFEASTVGDARPKAPEIRLRCGRKDERREWSREWGMEEFWGEERSWRKSEISLAGAEDGWVLNFKSVLGAQSDMAG